MRFLRKLFGRVKSWLRWPVDYSAAEWNRMAPRERRLIAALSGVFLLFAVMLSGYLVLDSISEMAQHNSDTREALAAIAAHRDEYLDAKSRMIAQEARIGGEAPQLAADLEAAARDAGIQIPETVPRPASAAGKRYLEHSLEVKLRKVDLRSLATFLSKVETGRRLIVVTRMQIRRSFAEGDKLDVELTATAYERVKEDQRKKGAAAGKGKG